MCQKYAFTLKLPNTRETSRYYCSIDQPLQYYYSKDQLVLLLDLERPATQLRTLKAHSIAFLRGESDEKVGDDYHQDDKDDNDHYEYGNEDAEKEEENNDDLDDQKEVNDDNGGAA